MRRKTYANEINFVTFTIVDWIDLFTRRMYNDFIIDNLTYCQDNKSLKIFAYVIMTNHIHLLLIQVKIFYQILEEISKAILQKNL